MNGWKVFKTAIMTEGNRVIVMSSHIYVKEKRNNFLLGS